MFLFQVDTHTDHVLLVQFQAALHLLLQEDAGEELLAHHAVGCRLAVHVALETPTTESVISFSQKTTFHASHCMQLQKYIYSHLIFTGDWNALHILRYAAVLLYTSV